MIWNKGNVAVLIGVLVVLSVTVPHLVVWLLQ
jgi:hypothetical protein